MKVCIWLTVYSQLLRESDVGSQGRNLQELKLKLWTFYKQKQRTLYSSHTANDYQSTHGSAPIVLLHQSAVMKMPIWQSDGFFNWDSLFSGKTRWVKLKQLWHLLSFVPHELVRLCRDTEMVPFLGCMMLSLLSFDAYDTPQSDIWNKALDSF